MPGAGSLSNRCVSLMMRRGKAVLAVAAAMVGGARRGALAVPGSTERCAGCEPKTGWDGRRWRWGIRGEGAAGKLGLRDREREGEEATPRLEDKARQERERERGEEGKGREERRQVRQL